ncbi:MAG: hypothetical protein HFE40_07385 [Clostridia bacterium]|nr:hypothetical protein [Clostridia bacterium]
MPYIDCKLTQKLTEEKKTAIKSELGKIINLMHKPESYLMVGICDNYDLYFSGKKLENGAYVGVKLFGKPSSADCEKATEAVCAMLKEELGIDGSSVYITYQGISDWGWNGGNF